eukprot:m.103098 g.103098  ORF g.103098 m.103098 type:complete len:172 (+) comp15210_c0_seq3:615-1130(+)
MRTQAEQHLGVAVSDVVVTVPAYFNDNQRQATRNAGVLAGLNVLRVVNEPTAAALSYGFGLDKPAESATIAVYDLGGGTFDISLLKLEDGIFEVLATNGDTFLGGEDVDAIVAEHLASEFATQHNLSSEKIDRQRLRQAAEQAKIDLDSAVRLAVAMQPSVTTAWPYRSLI